MKSFVWVGVVLLLAFFDATAALGLTGPVTEADAIRLFLDESPQARLVQFQRDAARADLSIGSEFANPAVAYQIEDAAGVRDEFLTFEQRLPVTGRRSLLQERAEAASSAAGLLGEHDLRNSVSSLRVAFYEVLHRDSEVDVLGRGEEELDRTVKMLREREREGEGSGYDVLRAEQEMAELQLEIGRAKAASAAARARFASFFDNSLAIGSVVLVGELALQESLWTVEEAVAKALAERADLLALQQESRQEEMGLRAARRQRFPEPVLSAGWKRVEALGESDTGFVASVMVPLPLFDRGKYAAASALAASARVELQEEILSRQIRAEVESARARAHAARRAAEQFGDSTEQRADELRRIAQLTYDEGEKGILELLDAFRTSLRMELQALAYRHEARREQIELDRVMGREVRP